MFDNRLCVIKSWFSIHIIGSMQEQDALYYCPIAHDMILTLCKEVHDCFFIRYLDFFN